MKKVFIIIFFIFSCGENKNIKEELIKTISNDIVLTLDKSQKLESINIVSFEPITEREEYHLLLNYIYYNLIELSNEQKEFITKISSAKSTDEIDQLKFEYQKLDDSINYYKKRERMISGLKAKEGKVNYYKVICVVSILDKNTKLINRDSLHLYINKKKYIFSEQEFVKYNLSKFK